MSPSQLEFSPVLASAYAIALYATMLLVAFLLSKTETISLALTPSGKRYGALDGFRGVLASGVFIHHSFVAFIYFRDGRWDWTASALFNHLGQTTVAMFFMITGFLFSLITMAPRVDWRALYLSRFARLFPIYAAVVGVAVLIVFALSHGELRVPAATLFKQLVLWLSFVVFDRPDINAFPMTWQLIAGVNWSLKYEVIFYAFGVPLLYLLPRIIPLRILLVLSISSVAGLSALIFHFHRGTVEALYAIYFLCGVFTAYVYTDPRLKSLIQRPPFRLIAGASTLLLFSQESAFSGLAIAVTLALFMAVVGNASGWGILHSRAARWLGDISYGIYLIHGLVLWLSLFLLRKVLNLATLGLFEYSLLMAVQGVVVVLISTASYVLLEKPIIQRAKSRAR